MHSQLQRFHHLHHADLVRLLVTSLQLNSLCKLNSAPTESSYLFTLLPDERNNHRALLGTKNTVPLR